MRSLWILALALGAWYVFGNRLLIALAPFVLAGLAGAFLYPLASRVRQGLRIPPSLAVAVSLVLVLTVLGALGVGLALLVAAQVEAALESLPRYVELLQAQLDALIARATEWYGLLPPTAIEFARENAQSLTGALESALVTVGQAVLGLVTAVPVLLGILAVALIATYFVTRDWERVKNAVLQLIPPPQRQMVRGVPARLWADALRYVRAQIILILITTVLSLAGLLVLGVDQWLILGLVGGMLDVMPLLGPGLLYVPWGIYALLVGQHGLGAGVLILYLVTAAARQLAEPRVIGGSVGVHPLLTLATLYISATLFGLPGFLIAPGLIVLGKAAWESGLIPWFRQAAAGSDGDPGSPPPGRLPQ